VPVLLVQHDPADAGTLADVLRHAGFEVTVSTTGEAPEPDESPEYDVVAIGMDRRLEEGLRLCQRLRAGGYLGAIVVLGAEASHLGVLLEAGADDFVVAPVKAPELVARLGMAVRRVMGRARRRWGPFDVDRARGKAYLRGQLLPLTERQYALLSCLLEAGGEIVSRQDLLSRVWARDEYPGSNRVEVHLSRLRDKLGPDAKMIETVRGAGYKLRREDGRGTRR
jgi:DNA-binding response OmpR family regulator